MAAGAVMGGVILTLFGALRFTLGVRGISTTATSGLVLLDKGSLGGREGAAVRLEPRAVVNE